PAGSSWHGDPFRLRRQGARLVARGAADDKGFILAQLEGVRRAVTHAGRDAPPINVRCLYEGEEEIGSPTMRRLVEKAGDRLVADAAVVCDTEATASGQPTLTVSCRGEITVNIEVCGPARDLHAGRFGGAIHNPAQVLAELLAALHDPLGRVGLPGFYRDVRALPGMNARDDELILAHAGVPTGWGEPGFGLDERITARPAVVVTRLDSGSRLAGPHHIIPARAAAQVNIRLVPDQDPRRIYRSLSDHARTFARCGIRVGTALLLAARPWEARTSHPAMTAAAGAIEAVFGVPPVAVRSGGGIPALAALDDAGVVETAVLAGFGSPADRAHGPGESVDPLRLELAAEMVARLLLRYRGSQQ
ncbi:MAG: hypothetical protein QOH66_2892, partial [Actinomycetota bacterium]|nr:hypothetical protein [Actinomycetota bacterium]